MARSVFLALKRNGMGKEGWVGAQSPIQIITLLIQHSVVLSRERNLEKARESERQGKKGIVLLDHLNVNAWKDGDQL